MTHKFLNIFSVIVGTILLLAIAGSPLQAQRTGTKRASPSVNLAALADLDQCRNGTEALPLGCTTADEWVNGNANHTNAHWSETEYISYRMKFTDLTLQSHVVIIGYDILKGTQHAIDYLGTYRATETTADPCAGVLVGAGAPHTFSVPPDTVTVTNMINPNNGLHVVQAPGEFTMWGGNITDIQYVGYAGGEERQIAITFTATITNPVLAWGGHIAWIGDWGAGKSASTISGSPYHMRLISLDGAGGSQDRALDNTAVIASGVINIKKEVFTAPPDTTNAAFTQFNFTATSNFGPIAFGLIDDNAGPGVDTQQSMAITSFGTGNTITVTETATNGWSLSNVNCMEDKTQDSTKNSLPLATIIVQANETVTCTFTNTQLVPTAAPATIAGRVIGQYQPVYNAVLVMTNLETGEVRMARTNSLGYYQFTSLETGHTYFVSVSAKRMRFNPDSRLVSLTNDIADLDFRAAPQ